MAGKAKQPSNTPKIVCDADDEEVEEEEEDEGKTEDKTEARTEGRTEGKTEAMGEEQEVEEEEVPSKPVVLPPKRAKSHPNIERAPKTNPLYTVTHPTPEAGLPERSHSPQVTFGNNSAPSGRGRLNVGEMVKGKIAWIVQKELSIRKSSRLKGKYYLVSRENDADSNEPKELVMRTDLGAGKSNRLKIEVKVMNTINSAKLPGRKKHFVEMLDHGKIDEYRFAVTCPLGPNLIQVRNKDLRRNFSRSTAMQAALQTFQAVWDLHEIGLLHRNLKRQNFVVGRGSQENKLFLVDFSLARRVNKKSKIPRKNVTVPRTVLFASRTHNKLEELSERDDLESWIYLVFDLFDQNYGLPWHKITDEKAAYVCKEKFFKHKYPRCYTIIPKDFKDLVSYIDTLAFADVPDYEYMQLKMKYIAQECNIDLTEKPEWVIASSLYKESE